MSFLMRGAFREMLLERTAVGSGSFFAGSLWSDRVVTPVKQTAGRPVPEGRTVKPSVLLMDRT